MALTIWRRHHSGSALCQIAPVIAIRTVSLVKQPLLNTAVDVDWGSNNRLLYRVLPNLANIPPGVYELDMSNPTGAPVRL